MLTWAQLQQKFDALEKLMPQLVRDQEDRGDLLSFWRAEIENRAQRRQIRNQGPHSLFNPSPESTPVSGRTR